MLPLAITQPHECGHGAFYNFLTNPVGTYPPQGGTSPFLWRRKYETEPLLEQEMKQKELHKIDAEIAKLIAESAKLNAETRWYPILVVTGMFAAIGTVMAVVIKFL
ncbi:hypothetical protein CGZ65_05775 [Neisseria weixii]|nr:hypothetical protein CGZ65_05775 [Neisseria weixii]